MEFKEDIRRYRDYLIRLVEKDEKITVYLNTEATRERIEQEAPDAVIVAIGAEPFVPPIKGREKVNVIHSAEVFGMESQLGETVAIVGGGLVGCELAVHLKQFCKKIELIEAGEELMPDGYDTPEERYWTIFCMEHDFERSGRESASAPLSDKVTIRLNSKCVSIDDQGLSIVDAAGERQHIKADKVIMATGLKQDAEKKQIFKNTAYDVIYIGDCEKVGNILGTSSSAYRASFRI